MGHTFPQEANMFDTLIAAIIFFVVIPVILNKSLGWRGNLK